jgi:hypothetical protein
MHYIRTTYNKNVVKARIIHCHYSTENDLNFTAEKTSDTSLESVNLFERRDKP